MATALLGRRPTMIVSTMPMLIHPTSANINGRARCRVRRKSRRHSAREILLEFAGIFLVTISMGTPGCPRFFYETRQCALFEQRTEEVTGVTRDRSRNCCPSGAGHFHQQVAQTRNRM